MAHRARGDAAGAAAAAAERSREPATDAPAVAITAPGRPERGLRTAGRRTASPAATIALAGLVGSGLVLCLAAADTDTLVPQSVRPVSALPLAGPLASLSFRLHAGELIACVALMFICYLVAVRYAAALPARRVIAAVVTVNLLALIAPPLFSTDVFSYEAYARMFATYSINPYVNGPHTIALDPLYPYIGADWINTPSVYGPLFTLLSGLLAHASAATSELVFKVVAALSSLGTVLLIWRAAKRRGVDPVAGIALFGLNPLVVLYGVGGGHNDLLMLLMSTAGVYAVLCRRDTTGGALIAISAAIKLTGVVVAPFAFAAHAPPPARARRLRFASGCLITAAVLTALGLAWFGTGLLHMPSTLESVQKQNPWGSLPGLLSTLTGGTTAHFLGIVFGVLCFGFCGWLLRAVWRGRLDWIEAAAWMTAAMLATASSVLPWYGAWLLPLVALCRDRRLWTIALALTSLMGFLTVAGYVPGGAFFGL